MNLCIIKRGHKFKVFILFLNRFHLLKFFIETLKNLFNNESGLFLVKWDFSFK